MRTFTFMKHLPLGAIAVFILVNPLAAPIRAAEPLPQPVARWSFEEQAAASVHDAVSGIDDRIAGRFERVAGPQGAAVRFDGYSTFIVRPAKPTTITDTHVAAQPDRIPRLDGDFSLATWIALDAYPWNWLPLVDQSREDQAGFSFGIDAFGHLGLRMAVDGGWQAVTSQKSIPLKQWTHVAATFDRARGLAVFIDGEQVASLAIAGSPTIAAGTDLIIGRIRRPMLPAPSDAIHPLDPVWYSLEGSLDELEIWSTSLSAAQVREIREAVHSQDLPSLHWAVLPSGPPGPGRFGAYPCSLAYDSGWDRSRRMGPGSDVVVRFDESAIRLVFWQGTAFEPAWVTENGKWYTDEFLEAYGPPGCTGGEDCEPMSDKQTRYAHVSVLESNDARAVVHWRYALTETRNYSGSFADPESGWSDWADEYWTVYPDGVAVRKQILWTSEPAEWAHEWQETIIINGPGQRPEDNIDLNALSLANMKGESFTYAWAPKATDGFDYPHGPASLPNPPGANIQVVNLRASHRPFQIVSPTDAKILPYNGERSYSTFEWWNHWPVAQIPSSGRPALAPDRASHSSLSHIYWNAFEKTDRSVTKLLLDGLTTRTASQLVPLAKSWINPPQMLVTGAAVADGYDPAQRAFTAHVIRGNEPVNVTLQASHDRPLVNPALVVTGWQGDVRVDLDGVAAEPGRKVRVGHSQQLTGDTLIVWLELESEVPVTVKLAAR